MKQMFYYELYRDTANVWLVSEVEIPDFRERVEKILEDMPHERLHGNKREHWWEIIRREVCEKLNCKEIKGSGSFDVEELRQMLHQERGHNNW